MKNNEWNKMIITMIFFGMSYLAAMYDDGQAIMDFDDGSKQMNRGLKADCNGWKRQVIINGMGRIMRGCGMDQMVVSKVSYLWGCDGLSIKVHDDEEEGVSGFYLKIEISDRCSDDLPFGESSIAAKSMQQLKEKAAKYLKSKKEVQEKKVKDLNEKYYQELNKHIRRITVDGYTFKDGDFKYYFSHDDNHQAKEVNVSFKEHPFVQTVKCWDVQFDATVSWDLEDLFVGRDLADLEEEIKQYFLKQFMDDLMISHWKPFADHKEDIGYKDIKHSDGEYYMTKISSRLFAKTIRFNKKNTSPAAIRRLVHGIEETMEEKRAVVRKGQEKDGEKAAEDGKWAEGGED